MDGIHGHTTTMTWGDFQSIIQLSIALNAVYAALFSFVDNIISEQAEQNSKRLFRLRQLDAIANPTVLDQKNSYRRILSTVRRAHKQLSEYNKNFLQPVSALFCVIGLGFLCYSSYNSGLPISNIWALFSCGLFLPFFLSMCVYICFYIILTRVALLSRRLILSTPTAVTPQTEEQ